MDLGFNSTGLQNTKKILTAVLSLLIVSIQHNNVTLMEDMMQDVEEEIRRVIKDNVKTPKTLRMVHYKIVMLLSISRSIQKLIALRERKHEPLTQQTELWHKTISKIENIFKLVLSGSKNNILFAEFVLCDILKFYRNYVALVSLKDESNKPFKQLVDTENEGKIEEEKAPDQDDDEESLSEDDLDGETEIKMELPGVLREDEDESSVAGKNSGILFEKFGLRLVKRHF